MTTAPTSEPATLAFVRRLLLVSLGAGIAGTGGELLLLGHVESLGQLIPVAALGVSVPILIWHVMSPGRPSVRTLQVLMTAFILSGVLGVGLHYDGNSEFERELHPGENGWTALGHTMAGATPLLAPGSMVLLGLVGVAHTYRHPSAAGASRQETV